MEVIKFTKSDLLYYANVTMSSEGVKKRMKLSFDVGIPSAEVLLSGFVLLNEHNKTTVQQECFQYIYLYQMVDTKTFVLSDTEGDSIATPDIDPVDPVEPKPTYQQPSLYDRMTVAEGAIMDITDMVMNMNF